MKIYYVCIIIVLMFVAVLPEYDPLITGLPTIVQVGEQALVNCTSDYSLPAATIDWFVDSEPQEVRFKFIKSQRNR
jgi:hypothetical protein